MSNQPDTTAKKNASPFPKKTAVRYGETFCFGATGVKVYMGKRTDKLEYEFTNGSGHDLKIVKDYDKNAWMMLPDDIKELPSAAERKPCSLNLFWEWQAPRGKQTQPTPKITKIEVREADTPLVEKLKQKQQAQHPELFGAVGEEYHAPPITNPNPHTAEELAEIERKGREAAEQLRQSAQTTKSAAESEADAHFGPKHSEQVKAWSAIKEPTAEKQSWSAYGHFKREAEAINELIDMGREVHTALGMELEKHVEQHGIGETCKKLQERLDYLKQALTPAHLIDNKEDQPVTITSDAAEDDVLREEVAEDIDPNYHAPEVAEITPEQWEEFLKEHNWTKRPFVLIALNAYSIEHGEGPVTRLGEWAFNLTTAEEVIAKFVDNAANAASQPKTNAQTTPQDDSQPSAPVQPPTQEQASQSAKPAASDAIDGEIVDQPKQLATIPNTGLAPLPMVAQWDIMKQQASVLLKSGFLPQSIKTEAQVITIMMMGSALQVDPIVALNNINVINGKPTVAPQLMLALVRRSGQLESFKITDDGQCATVEIKRRGEPMHIEKFSQDDAVAMGLAGKDNWKKQAPTMRQWRCVAAACRKVFSDVVWGIASYTAEEIDPDIVVDYAA